MSEAGKQPPTGPGAGSRSGGAAPTAAAENPEKPSLGAFLTAARERRGVTREEAVKETRIPAHYIVMIESDNYTLISDQLYVLPFIRRYAGFLGLDSEEIAIRFVREVQRAETNVVKMSQPIVDRRRGHRRPWVWATAVITLAIAAAGFYLGSHRLLGLFRPEPAATVETPRGAAIGEKPGAPALAAPAESGASARTGAPASGESITQKPAGDQQPAPAAGP